MQTSLVMVAGCHDYLRNASPLGWCMDNTSRTFAPCDEACKHLDGEKRSCKVCCTQTVSTEQAYLKGMALARQKSKQLFAAGATLMVLPTYSKRYDRRIMAWHGEHKEC